MPQKEKIMRTVYITILALLLAAPSASLAGEAQFYGDQFRPVASANSCTRAENDSSDTAGDDHTWVSYNCPDASDKYFIVHFTIPQNYVHLPLVFTGFDIQINAQASDTAGGTVRWVADMGCATTAAPNWDNISYGTAQSGSMTLTTNTTSKAVTTVASVSPAAAFMAGDTCVVRIMRDGDGTTGTDNYTNTVRAYYVGVTWP